MYQTSPNYLEDWSPKKKKKKNYQDDTNLSAKLLLTNFNYLVQSNSSLKPFFI